MPVDSQELIAPPPLEINHQPTAKPRWDYTEINRRYLHPAYEEQSAAPTELTFGGRPTIARDKPINGGVYLVGGKGEAVVVDDRKYDELNNVYFQLMSRINYAQQLTGRPANTLALESVYSLVRELLPYSLEGINKLHQQMQTETDRKIALDSYLIAQVGVCRHQALLGGYLLERMVKEGILRGRVSVDRNIIPGKGGHAWIRYTNSAGNVFILDTAQGFIGTLEEANRKAQWNYNRPEDKPNPKETTIQRLSRIFRGAFKGN